MLFRAASGGSRIRETLRVPPEVLLQFQEKGSYRLADVLAYVSWILDRSRAPLADGPGPPGPPGGDGPPPLIDDDDDGSPAVSGPDSASSAASGQESASPAASKRDSASPAASGQESASPQFGRRVVYLLDWFAPHLDPSVDALINGAGHAVLRVGGHLTGLVQVEDTHAHGPMTKIYKKQESLEAYEQLTLRPDKLPSTSRQTVLDRALCSWQAVDHAACSRGFVSNGIANKLDGSEDDTLTLEVAEYWAELKMGGVHGLRAKVMAEVAKLVDEGIVSSFDDYKSILEEYDVHSPHLEGQEAFGQVIVDGDGEDVVDATEDDTGDTDRDDGDDDDDDGPSGGGDGLGGGGHEDLPPPAGEPHDGGSEPDYPPPAVPPRGPAHSGSAAAAAATPTASRHARLRAKAAAIAPSWTVTHPFKEEASRQISEAMNQQKLAIETALQAMVTIGGDRPMEDTLRRRLRDVVKKLHRSGDENRTCLRAIALERQAKVEVARAEHKAEEARTIELKLMVELRKNEAEIAKAKSKEASHAAKAALESAKKDRDEAARLRAKQEEDDRKLGTEFAAALVGQLDEYLRAGPFGDERRARCQRLALNQARRKAGLHKIDVPRFWSPTTSGLVKLVGDGSNRRLAAKSEVLYASSEFSWALFGRGKFGQEGRWSPQNEPRYAFRCLVERTMPGYFDLFGGRYGVDNLLAECRNIVDLAFVAANWRYTVLVQQQFYRSGLAEWPPVEDWWTSKLSSATAAAAASSQAAAAGAASSSAAASCPADVSSGSTGSGMTHATAATTSQGVGGMHGATAGPASTE